MTTGSQIIDTNSRGLPVHPLILLPSGRVFNPNSCTKFSGYFHPEDAFLELLDNQCFSSALQQAINNPKPPLSASVRRPHAVSWLNLELNPPLMNDVVAVIMPIIGWTRTVSFVLPATRGTSMPCYVEMNHNMEHWRISQLLNLRLIIAVPWPDLLPFHGRSCFTKFRPNPFIDLMNYATRGVNVTVIPNLFEEATRDLLITLLISTLKGLGKDSDRALDIYLDLVDTSAPIENFLSKKENFVGANQTGSCSNLQVPKRRLTTTTGGQATLTDTCPRKQTSPPPPPSLTAPPTSLTLATNRGPNTAFCTTSRWVIKSDAVTNPIGTQKTLRETVVGFIGLTSAIALNTANMLREGLGMKIIYHQKYPLLEMNGFEFVADLNYLLQRSDAVILADDLSPLRTSLAKAVRPRSPVPHRPARRSHFSLQDGDFDNLPPSSIFISTSPLQSFSFGALTNALRNQKLAGAGFVIPLDGSLDSDDLQSLYHLDNVIVVPPPASPGCAPRHLRRTLAALVLEALSEGLGFPSLCPPELPSVTNKKLFSGLSNTEKSTSLAAAGRELGRRVSSRIQILLSELISALRPPVGGVAVGESGPRNGPLFTTHDTTSQASSVLLLGL